MQTYSFGPYTVNYVPRADWDLIGRRNGVYTGPHNYHALVPHHTVTAYVEADLSIVIQKMRLLQNLRPDLGQDIPYNFVAFADPDPNTCWIAEGRGIGWTGAHTSGYNSSTHAVAFWGNSIVDPVNPGILEGMRWVGRLMLTSGCPVDTPTFDHGSYPNQGTQCAGSGIRKHLPELQPPFDTPGIPVPTPTLDEDDDLLPFNERLTPFNTQNLIGNNAICYDHLALPGGTKVRVSPADPAVNGGGGFYTGLYSPSQGLVGQEQAVWWGIYIEYTIPGPATSVQPWTIVTQANCRLNIYPYKPVVEV